MRGLVLALLQCDGDHKNPATLWHDLRMPKAAPVVTLRVNGKIVKAICPKCRDPLALGDEVSSAKDQEAKLQEVFSRHFNARHRGEDASLDGLRKR